MAEVNYVCPHCGSEQIQRYSIAYTNGISDVTATTTGVGISSGGVLGVGGAKTSGTAQTALSQSVAPPSKYSYLRELFIAFVVIPIVFGLLNDLLLPFKWKWVFILSFVYLYFHTYKVAFNYNQNIYPKDMEDWNKSWLCMKCGHRFIL